MNLKRTLQKMRSGWSPFIAIAVTTLVAIAISVYCLLSGWVIIFQNLFYVPIIIACVYYTKKGFAFSVALSLFYLFLIIAFTRDSAVIVQALIRVVIFAGIAGVVTFLSIKRKRMEKVLLESEELKRSEEKFRKSEERCRSTLDNMMEGCQIIGSDWRYIYLNDSADVHNRRPKEELLGKKYTEMWPGVEATEVFKIIKRCMEERVHQHMENEFVFPDGAKGWFDLRIQPVPEGIFIQSVDITERKRVEETLKESEKRLNLLINGVTDYAIYLLDAKGHVIYWNPGAERIKGYRADEIIGQNYSQFFTPEDQQNNKPQHLLAAAESLGHYEDEGLRVRKDESLFWANAIITALRNDDGTLYGFAKITRDITEQKRAEEEIRRLNAELEERVAKRTAQLEESNKELEAFTYSVSHDLRAPLRYINGYVDLLVKRFPASLPEKGKHYLDSITDSVHQMGTLIDDLLQFSRTGRQEMRQAQVSMNQLLAEVLAYIKRNNPERAIDWHIAALPDVSGDPAMLRLVWFNLLDNAVKFTRTKKKARVEIGVREENEEFVFSVRDNGAGFDMRYSQKLFGVFQRLHPTAEYEGTGVGLAIVRRIILRHGGRTWAEAEIDKGATFFFSVPNKKEET